MNAAESPLDPARASLRAIVPSGEPWTLNLRAGQTLRILDLEGNQAVDTLFYNDDDPAERYDAQATLRAQRRVYLTTGSRLMSNRGRAMLEISADTCGRHDTLGGACAQESNRVRYALDKGHLHACRNSFLRALAHDHKVAGRLDKRDLAPNINFFMNVPLTPAGGFRFADGVSAPGKYVEMRALINVLVLISNCPQLNNPCNGWNPTPVELLVWD